MRIEGFGEEVEAIVQSLQCRAGLIEQHWVILFGLISAGLTRIPCIAIWIDSIHSRDSSERCLSEKETALFNLDNTSYLYDLTSTYFKGQHRVETHIFLCVLAYHLLVVLN